MPKAFWGHKFSSKKLSKLNSKFNNKLIIFIIAFGVIGAITLLAIRAASPTVSIEPESSTITGPAALCGNDVNASNHDCVQFKTASTSGHGAGYNKLGFYPCPQGNTTFGAQQVTCMNNLASWLGRTSTPKIPYIVLMASGDSPNTMEGNGYGYMAAAGAFQTVNPKPTIVISVPLAFVYDGCEPAQTTCAAVCNLGTNNTHCFDKIANGTYDCNYRRLIQYFKTANYNSSNLIIRLGWEYDGNWMPWAARNNPAQFIAAYQHVHDVLINTIQPPAPGTDTCPGHPSGIPGLKFDLAGDPGQTATPGTTSTPPSVWQSGNITYPGDSYVDIIGMDVYHEAGATGCSTPVDNFTTVIQPSLTLQKNFAIAYGKQVSYPEWGQKKNPDCPNFIQSMGTWFDGLPTSGGGSLAYHSYFNESTDGAFTIYNAVSNLPSGNNPLSSAKFKSLFGN